MSDDLLVISLLAMHVGGLACFALAQDKHWKALNVKCKRQTRIMPIGWGSLALSLLLAWTYQGVIFGSLIWVLMLPPSGCVIALILAWRPQWLRWLAKLLSR